MDRWALIEGNLVANVVEQETPPFIGGVWINITGKHVGPGYTYENGVFFPPPPPPRIVTKVDMLTKRFTMAEFTGIVTASKTDPAVEAWMIIFESAATIDLDSQNTKDGIAMLVSKNLLTQARADEILNGPI